MLALMQEEVLLRPRAELLLASPVIPDNASYPSYRNEVNALIELGIAREESADGFLERLVTANLAGTTSYAAALRCWSQFSTEAFLAKILFEQFRRNSMISWNDAVMPCDGSTLITFNNYQFSATGFSWLKPMLRFKGANRPKPTPVVMDILAKRCMEYDVKSFAERMTRAGQNKQTKLRFLGIIAAFDFEETAWKLAKSEGLLTINLKEHFGKYAFEALLQAQELLKNVAGEPLRAEDIHYEKFTETLENLKTNPLVVELRSLGFESVSGLIMRSEGYENIQLNLKVRLKNGQEREADVTGDKSGGEKLFILECKAEAANKPLDSSYVRKFYTETVPAYVASKQNGNLLECRAEIWTTGVISSDAQNALNETKLNPLIKPALLSREDIKNRVPKKLASCKRLLEAISTH